MANGRLWRDPDFISQLIKRMEYAAERRKRKTNAGVAAGGQEDEPEDPYVKMARKARNLKDLLHVRPSLPGKKVPTSID